MFYLNRLLSGRSLKSLALISCFVIVAVAIWFLGPFFGFGKIRPLEPIAPRVVFIVLALLWLARIWWRVPLFVMLALTCCVLVWEIGPFFLTGDVYPLVSKLNRLIVLAIIVFITLLYAAWKLLLALSVNPDLLQNLIRFHKARPDVQNDASAVAAVIRNAASWTRKMNSSVSLWQRCFLAKKAHSELPWYLVLGNESSGKTSLIASSGQNFPQPEQLSRVGTPAMPTAHCECWFANDALFIDTAGKYVNDSKTWQAQWDSLVNAIGKYRPVKGVNGAIVAISAADILQGNKAELRDLAVAIRSRLGELRLQLGVRFPVYVVLTKLDCLSGFEEYFRNLTAEGREQIWGVTFPYGGKSKISESQLKDNITHELHLLEERLDNNMNLRQQEEYAVVDRKKMYALPEDFRILSHELAGVVQNIFFASRYDETQFFSSLRGIYFSSSQQPGDAPLPNNTTLVQRWRNYLSGKNVTLVDSETPDETELLISPVAGGRQYFLRKLFAEIIVKDAGLVRDNHNMALRSRLRNVAGHCACVLATIWLINGLVTSYQNNNRYLESVAQHVQQLEQSTATFIKTSQEKLLPELLSMSQNLPEFGALNIESPDWHYRYGLYTGKKVAANAESLYQFFLHQFLLPQVEAQAGKTLQDALESGDRDRVYDALKLYLMVAGEGKFDSQYAINAIADQWDLAGKAQAYGDRSVLVAHLSYLFNLPDWKPEGLHADPQLIKQARSLLAQQNVTARLYGRLKTRLQADAPENMTLNQMTGSDTPQIFTLADRKLLGNGIPGLFTYAGYHDVIKKKELYQVTSLWAEDQWVMGLTGENAEAAIKVHDGVSALYLQEYRQYWERFLANIRLVSVAPQDSDSPDFSGDIYMLRTLASGSSPLQNLAKELVKQTTLTAQDNLLPENLDIVRTPNALNNAKKINKALALRERKQVAEGVDNVFSPLRAFVTGSGSVDAKNSSNQGIPGTELSKIMGKLMDQYTLLVISSSAINQGDVSTASDSGKVMAAAAQTWPDPFKNIIEPLLSGIYEKVDRQTVASSQQSIDAGPGEVCRNTLEGRYPFADSEREASLSDIEHFFAKGGVADEYFQQKLADKVDTSVLPWRYKGGAQSEGLQMFEQATEIRRALFQDDEGKKLALHLAVSLPYMSPTITQLTVHMEGVNFKYAHGPVTPMPFIWPGAHSGVSLSAIPRVPMAAQETADTTAGNTAGNQERIEGVWSLFHWLDKGELSEDSTGNEQVYTFPIDTRRVDIAVSGLTYGEMPIVQLLRDFKCPELQP